MPETARERLERLRQEQSQPQTARERLEALRRAQTEGIDSSPVESPMRLRTPLAQMSGQTLSTLTPRRTPSNVTAATQAGVDVTTGSPVGRFAGGFQQNPEMAADLIQRRLSERFGQDVRIRMGPESGALEYLNPETRRWTMVNEAVSTLGDLAGAAGPSLPIVGAIAGELLGAPIGIGPVGAGLGGALGEAGRRGIGNLMGVRDETAGQVAAGAAGIGVLEAGGAAAGNLIARGAQRIRGMFRPQVMTPDRAQILRIQAERSQQLADEISAATGQPFQPFTGQLTGDPQILAEQARLRNDEEFGLPIRTQEQQNKTALEAYFDTITPQGAGNQTAVGRGIQNEARDQTQPRVEAIREGVDTQLRELENLTSQLSRTDDVSTGTALREQILSLRQSVSAAEDARWNAVREAYGHNPETALSDVRLPVTGELESTIRRLRVEASEALDPAMASGKSQLAGDRLLPDMGELSPEDKDLLTSFGVDFEETHTLDLHQTQLLLSFLRRRERIAMTNTVATDPEGRDISRIRDALQNQRNEYLRQNNPELLAQIQDAEDFTRRRAQTFDDGLVGEIIRRDANGYMLTNPQVVARVFGSSDVESMRHLMSVVTQHPAGLSTLQDGIMAFYRNEVVEDGIPNAARHRTFIRRHGDILDTVFGTQANRVRTLGEMERVVTANRQRLERFERSVAESFRGRVQDIAPERLVETMFSSQWSVADARRMMNLATEAGYDGLYRQAIGDRIARQYVTTNGISIDALQKFFYKEEEKLTAIFGRNYRANMERLFRGVEMSRLTATAANRTRRPSLFESLARVIYARPMSAEGVALTRARSFRERAVERAWAQIVSDPRMLNQVVNNGNRLVTERRVSELLGLMGASAAAYELESAE